MQLKVAVIGLGQQALEDHLPALQESSLYELLAVCDIDQAIVDNVAAQYGVKGFTSVEELLSSLKLDVVIIAVPHAQYLDIISKVAKQGIHVIKEKPFATSVQEASALQRIIRENNIFVGVTVQRRFNPIFQAFPQLKKRIGKIYSIEGRYTMNVTALDVGWRASKSLAGGGALIDMGYHFVDLLVWYFGMPNSVTARITRGNRPGQQYDVEDTVQMLFDYKHGDLPEEKTVGNFIISRVYPQKEEKLTAFGTHGVLELQRGLIRRLDNQGEEIERLERKGRWLSAAVEQLEFFAREIQGAKTREVSNLHEHLQHIAIIEAAYESDRTFSSSSPQQFYQSLIAN